MSVIAAGARTGIGRFMGSLKNHSATDLGGIAIAGALQNAGISGSDVDYVIMGHVLQAGAGQNSARQAALKGGIPMNVPSITINKLCLSGINAIALASQMIKAGEAEIVVAGGMESMSNAPHLMVGSREGVKYGDWTMKDSLAFDGLFCAIDNLGMGESTEKYTAEKGLKRQAQDEFSAMSHQKAASALSTGIFDNEIVAVEIPQRKGDPISFATDEGVRDDTTVETLAGLRPAFAKDGLITAGSSSQISDGAAALVIMSEAKAKELGIDYLATIGAHGMVAGPSASLLNQPSQAILAACAKEGISASDLAVLEINEAFASVALASIEELGVEAGKVNLHGGAIALGHPIGMSGARIVLHLALELKRRGGGIGAAALCGGGGQGDALILKA
jgi:acetyl-CoA C-acetyltransferase